MDVSKAHDIVHTFNGGTHAGCKFCQGEMTEAELKKEATKIAAENYRPRVNPALPLDQRLLTYEELDGKARNNLEDSSFAYIDSKGGKHLPIPDASHVRNALARFNQTHFDNDDDKKAALAKIHAAAKKFGVDVSEKKASEPTVVTTIDIMSFSEANNVPKRIKVLPLGTIKSPVYGEVKIDKKVMDDIVKHFEESVRASSKSAGLPIDFEHGDTQFKDMAAGWIKKLSAEKDGMYAEVEWTEPGANALQKKLYKFISPAFYFKGYKDLETGESVENVLTGAGLVNKPGMPHSLPPLVYSEQNQNTPLTDDSHSATVFIELKNEISSLPKMNLKEIAAKEKTARTSEEQTFLVTNKNDLTFSEYKKEFPDEFKEPVREKQEVKPGQVLMSEQEVSELKTFRERMIREDSIAEVKKLTFAEKGIKLPADQVEKMADVRLTLSGDALKNFDEALKNLPVKEIFEEKGSDKGINLSENPGQQLADLAKAKQAEAKKNGVEMSYSEAEDAIGREKPELYQAAYARN